jgi:predicted component of type VI protein secretion system
VNLMVLHQLTLLEKSAREAREALVVSVQMLQEAQSAPKIAAPTASQSAVLLSANGKVEGRTNVAGVVGKAGPMPSASDQMQKQAAHLHDHGRMQVSNAVAVALDLAELVGISIRPTKPEVG